MQTAQAGVLLIAFDADAKQFEKQELYVCSNNFIADMWKHKESVLTNLGKNILIKMFPKS